MPKPITFLKPLTFTASLLPLLWLVGAAAAGGLGANPVEAIIRFNGDWALRFLLITLAVTPVVKLSGWSAPMRVRRMLGLFAFFYACGHLLAYLVLDQGLAWGAIGADILERPYITVGMLAFLLLVPLAVTSTNGMIRRLGGKRWRRLHRLVYLIGFLAVLHFYLMVKADVTEPLIYGAIYLALMGYRAWAAGGRFFDISRFRLKN